MAGGWRLDITTRTLPCFLRFHKIAAWSNSCAPTSWACVVSRGISIGGCVRCILCSSLQITVGAERLATFAHGSERLATTKQSTHASDCLCVIQRTIA